MNAIKVIRYDELHGGRDERFDKVCPICKSAIGYPCTQPKTDGSECVTWVHPERIQDVLNTAKP